MAKTEKTQKMYLGRAGQMYVLSEFLERGYNVAIPEVDVGDDAFVVRDDDGTYSRVQVKTATAVERGYGYSAQFAIGLSDIKTATVPDTVFLLVSRRGDRWGDVLLIPRAKLYEEHQVHKVGSKNNSDLVVFYVAFKAGKTTCSGRSLGAYMNNWNPWPRITH